MVAVLALFYGAITFLSAFHQVDACIRGLAWATDNRYAPRISNLPLVGWHYHWQDGAVPQMAAKAPFVPMFWGPRHWDKWSKTKNWMWQHRPKYVIGFNEPDIGSQANMNAYYAADVWMKEIQPWKNRGTNLISPCIAWDQNWMATFLGEVRKRGGRVDAICLHWYGPYTGLNNFKKFVTQAHQRFGKPIWITEIGITSSSHPSTRQVKAFLMNAFQWLDTQTYVSHCAWFGCFESNRAPDSFATGKNSFFKPGGALSDMGFWYGYTKHPNKRSFSSRHHLLSRADEDTLDDVDSTDPGSCEVCDKRTAQMDKWEKDHPMTIDARVAEPEAEAEPEPELEASA